MMEQMNEWVNIPALYLLCAYHCAVLSYIRARPGRVGGKRELLGLLGLGFFYSTVLFSNPNAQGLRFLLCMGCIWGGMAVCLRLLLRLSWREAAYMTVRAFFAGEFAASLCWQLVYYCMANTALTGRLELTLLVMVPFYALWFFVVFWTERQLCQGKPPMRVGRRDCLLALMIGCFLYFLANISYCFEDSPFSAPSLPQTYVLRTLTEFGAVAILLAYHYHLVDVGNQLKLQSMLDAWRAQEDHLRTYEASVALVNQRYHDLKHQLQLLKENLSSEEKLGYVQDLEKELELYEAQDKTGNPILDTVLTAKHMECLREGICLTSVVDGAALSFLHPLDNCALFGNLLDNALECEKKIREKDQRLICMNVSRVKSHVRICLRNICQERVEFREGLPLSTKGEGHGIGTASVRRIVEKYQGSLMMQWEEGWFTVSILLPEGGGEGEQVGEGSPFRRDLPRK